MAATRIVVLISFLVGLGLSAPGCMAVAADRNDPTSQITKAQFEDLQSRIRALQLQLGTLARTQAAPTPQDLMQQHRLTMQHRMRDKQRMPWMHRGSGAVPGPTGPGMMHRGMRGPGVRGDWMTGCPMTGQPGSGWALPPGLDADQYRSPMPEPMQRLHDEMAKIESTADPVERQRLLQEHWRQMYRELQTLRGMGWMRGGPLPGGTAAEPMPQPSSTGARRVGQFCAQCHATPSPGLHTAGERAAT